jgi:amino-acid N-acetyltransferase
MLLLLWANTFIVTIDAAGLLDFTVRGAEEQMQQNTCFRKADLGKDPKDHAVLEQLGIRTARVSDVEQLLSLINDCDASEVMLPRGPKYLFENIRDFVVVEAETAAGQRRIVACGSLHVLWKNVAEIRSLSIDPEYQRQGLGSKIVLHLLEDARQIGINMVCTFTMATHFFEKLGFSLKEKEELPSKVFGECNNCPKYFRCNETGLIIDCSEHRE